MTEMLANRYFAAGRFEAAAEYFEHVLRRHPHHLGARKKLTVCFAQLGRIREALELAAGLMADQPQALTHTDPLEEGFPCPDLVGAFLDRGRSLPAGEHHATLAVLHLFCDPRRALLELDRAADERPVLPEARTLRNLVQRHLEANHV